MFILQIQKERCRSDPASSFARTDFRPHLEALRGCSTSFAPECDCWLSEFETVLFLGCSVTPHCFGPIFSGSHWRSESSDSVVDVSHHASVSAQQLFCSPGRDIPVDKRFCFSVCVTICHLFMAANPHAIPTTLARRTRIGSTDVHDTSWR